VSLAGCLYYHGTHESRSTPLFAWDAANVAHVERHGLGPAEVQEALLDPARRGADAYRAGDERRRAYLCATPSGRVLFVVLTRRAGRLRVVTARDATDREKRRYGRTN